MDLAHRIAATVASAVLLTGLVSTLLGFDPQSSAVPENRRRSPPPTAPISNWQTYIDQTNAYLGDNFGFRGMLIRGHALFREHVLDANSGDNRFLDAIGIGN